MAAGRVYSPAYGRTWMSFNYVQALQDAFAAGQKQGYETGIAHGELLGRIALAQELESCLREPLTAESAGVVLAKQVH